MSSTESTTVVSHVTGDLFAAPEGTVMVQACNTQGSWGAGIALAFREKYPVQYKQYTAHCQEHGSTLVGTCLIIPGEKHHIACLFTSRGYGKRKDKPAEILTATRTALQDLSRQNEEGRKLHACRFNSGKFAVPWERTEAIIQELGLEMVVYSPEIEH